MKRHVWAIALAVPLLMGNEAQCDGKKTSDTIQREQQERILMEGTMSVGMPAIKNFREKRILKDILELRDQDGIVTYTYVFSEMTGKFVWFCDSLGYPIPAATQFTNPQKWVSHHQHGAIGLPQADPNGLFSPASAEGSWVMCNDVASKKARPQYSESRLSTFTFKRD
jgi:hypothetical protein